jgi:hypothetical protein
MNYRKSCLTFVGIRVFLKATLNPQVSLFAVPVHDPISRDCAQSPRSTVPVSLLKGSTMPDQIAQDGLTDNNAAGLAYVTIIPAIIFLVVAPYN